MVDVHLHVVDNELRRGRKELLLRVEPDHWGPFQGQLLGLFADFTDDERGPKCRPKRGQKDETLHLGQL